MDDGHQMDYSQITDNIFIGSNLCKGNVCPIHGPEFKKLNITAEINLTREHEEIAPQEIDLYAWIPVKDRGVPNKCQFALGTSIINEAVNNNQNIYIHCKNGHGRSPTIVAAYLIRFQNKSVSEAVNLIKSKRPEIHLEESQLEALNEFIQNK